MKHHFEKFTRQSPTLFQRAIMRLRDTFRRLYGKVYGSPLLAAWAEPEWLSAVWKLAHTTHGSGQTLDSVFVKKRVYQEADGSWWCATTPLSQEETFAAYARILVAGQRAAEQQRNRGKDLVWGVEDLFLSSRDKPVEQLELRDFRRMSEAWAANSVTFVTLGKTPDAPIMRLLKCRVRDPLVDRAMILRYGKTELAETIRAIDEADAS